MSTTSKRHLTSDIISESAVVITVSTVGFGEVRELSEEGMLFTSILIMGSLGTFAYSISALTTYFVNGEYRTTFKEARLKQEVEKLSNHVIVCGTGRVGEMAVQELLDHNTPVVIVENDAEKADSLSAEGHIVISGDATRDENLASAGITKAKSVITTLPSDAQNLYVVLAAREMAPNIHIVSRASKLNSVSKLRVAGANNVIMPDKVGGAHMASLVARLTSLMVWDMGNSSLKAIFARSPNSCISVAAALTTCRPRARPPHHQFLCPTKGEGGGLFLSPLRLLPL